jgi:hypothetical protein
MEMPRPIRNLSDMEIDEISLVDKGANQHAMITIAKRATEEDVMPDLYSEDGSLVDENALQDGDIVFDAEGNAYQFEAGEEEVEEEHKEEPVSVGKSAFGTRQTTPATTSFSDQVREELSKAYTDADRDAVITKAFGRIDELEKAQRQAEEIAKSERDLRLTREYVAKAADYNLPVDPQELGPVLYRMAESMSYEDCAVIAKCLETAGDALFQEIGYQGGGDNADVMSMVEQKAVEIGKSASPQGVTEVFDSSPEAYDEYLRAQRGNF